MVEIKKFNVISTKNFIISKYGNEALSKVINALDDKNKELIDTILLPNDWISLNVFLNFVETASNVLENGNESFIIQAQKYNCKNESQSIFKLLLKISTTAFALKSIPIVFKAFFKSNNANMEAKIIEISKNNFEATIMTFEKENHLIEKGILGWWTQMMEMTGAKNIEIKILHSIKLGNGYCKYSCKWSD